MCKCKCNCNCICICSISLTSVELSHIDVRWIDSPWPYQLPNMVIPTLHTLSFLWLSSVDSTPHRFSKNRIHDIFSIIILSFIITAPNARTVHAQQAAARTPIDAVLLTANFASFPQPPNRFLNGPHISVRVTLSTR